MTTARQQRIDLLRQRQPLAELERKWNKVKDSRHARTLLDSRMAGLGPRKG